MSYAFKTEFGRNVFYQKYAQGINDTWPLLAQRMVDDVCGTRNGTTHALMSVNDRAELVQAITAMKFVPAGRYLYYAGRDVSFFNNCLVYVSKDDTREAWADFLYQATSALMSGAGIGNCYSVFRPEGLPLGRSGGLSSGPLPLMACANEIGRNVMQGGSRRSALYASLHWDHGDIHKFITCKEYDDATKARKEADFNSPAPMDMTNISVNWDDAGLKAASVKGSEGHTTWMMTLEGMLRSAEPGFSFNLGENQDEVGRNACAEVTSPDDCDICNLGSMNIANITSIQELDDLTQLAAKFLICGSIRAHVPTEKVRLVRELNRTTGLGVMGVHEWLLQRGEKYRMSSTLQQWMQVLKTATKKGADEQCDRFYLSRPRKYNAIAPAGSIGILAGTTTGVEPLFAPAYKRRYLRDGTTWVYQNVVDPTAARIIQDYGITNPDTMDCAYNIGYEQRIEFQADMQDHIDMAISSTCNLPAWGTEGNNEEGVEAFSDILLKYAPRLRGFTAYADGCRGGQPLTVMPYSEAIKDTSTVHVENEGTCLSGT